MSPSIKCAAAVAISIARRDASSIVHGCVTSLDRRPRSFTRCNAALDRHLSLRLGESPAVIAIKVVGSWGLLKS